MRVRKKKWTTTELSTNERVITDNELQKGKWNEYFNNNNPIYLEIGCGKGRFITKTAELNPNINFVAIERQKHVICSATRKAKEENINNIAFMIADIKDLSLFFNENELSRIYINFCDPWENKKKWAKRRLTHVNFLDVYKTLLINNGEIFFKTDNKSLFEFSLNQFCERDWKLRNICLDLLNSDFEGNIMTEYEEKFSGRGMNIHRLEAINRK